MHCSDTLSIKAIWTAILANLENKDPLTIRAATYAIQGAIMGTRQLSDYINVGKGYDEQLTFFAAFATHFPRSFRRFAAFFCSLHRSGAAGGELVDGVPAESTADRARCGA
jgi:hypothetical protein